MVDRLSAVDCRSCTSRPTTPDAPSGGGPPQPCRLSGAVRPNLRYERLVALVEERSCRRARDKTPPSSGFRSGWPTGLGRTIRTSNPPSAITYPPGCPIPGTASSCANSFCARIQSRPLSRHRPLWELPIEGPRGPAVAIAPRTTTDRGTVSRDRPGARCSRRRPQCCASRGSCGIPRPVAEPEASWCSMRCLDRCAARARLADIVTLGRARRPPHRRPALRGPAAFCRGAAGPVSGPVRHRLQCVPVSAPVRTRTTCALSELRRMPLGQDVSVNDVGLTACGHPVPARYLAALRGEPVEHTTTPAASGSP